MRKPKRSIILATLAILLLLSGCAALRKSAHDGQAQGPADEMTVKVDDSSAPGTRTKASTAGIENLIDEFERTSIYFDFDRYSLSPAARATLLTKKELLDSHGDLAVQIQGNCDERGTLEYNLALGERRAKAAKDFLVTSGVAEDRIETISYGSEKPLNPGHDEKAWAQNRNARFVITNK